MVKSNRPIKSAPAGFPTSNTFQHETLEVPGIQPGGNANLEHGPLALDPCNAQSAFPDDLFHAVQHVGRDVGGRVGVGVDAHVSRHGRSNSS